MNLNHPVADLWKLQQKVIPIDVIKEDAEVFFYCAARMAVNVPPAPLGIDPHDFVESVNSLWRLYTGQLRRDTPREALIADAIRDSQSCKWGFCVGMTCMITMLQTLRETADLLKKPVEPQLKIFRTRVLNEVSSFVETNGYTMQ